MIGSPLHRLAARAALLGLLLAVVAAVPGVAIASLPAHPAPTHDCCAADAPPMPQGDCGTAPCCIEKPAPRTFSVLTGDALPFVLPATSVASLEPAVPETAPTRAAPSPHARSAPLHLLFVTFLT